MAVKILKKEDLPCLLGKWAQSARVLAPARQEEMTNLAPWEPGVQLDLGRNTWKPLKELFFPRSERMFAFSGDRMNAELSPIDHDTKQTIVFGVRPCDARSLALLDRVFLDERFTDDLYKARRERMVLAGLGCNKPLRSCFCTSVAGDPHGTEGLDVLFVDIGEEYAVYPLTGRGESLVGHLPEDSGEAKARASALADLARDMMPRYPAEDLPDKLTHMFEHEIWDRIHEKCLGCAACAYLCPTCHCFDVADEAKTTEGHRVRNWDSCMFPLFTLHTSGHNPRTSGKQRMRQRIMHKFNYFPVNSGAIACVGCGRCVEVCPVNTDIREVISEIGEVK